MSCSLEPAIYSFDTGQQIPFLTVDNMAVANKDVHYQVKHRL